MDTLGACAELVSGQEEDFTDFMMFRSGLIRTGQDQSELVRTVQN